jgi:flavoprotein
MSEERPNLATFGNVQRNVPVSFCCGCICVDYCIKNSTKGMAQLKLLVEAKKVELPTEIAKMVEIDTAE